MGILSFLGIGKELAEPIEAIGHIVTKDKDRLEIEKDRHKIDVEAKVAETDAEVRGRTSELETAKTLLLDGKFLNSSCMSLIGWTAGACVALYWIPQLLVTNYIWASNCLAMNKFTPFPIPPDNLYNLVWLLFGFGGYSLIKHKIS